MNRIESFFKNDRTPLVTNLIIINVLCWIATLSLMRTGHTNMIDLLGMHYWRAPDFKIWQLFTYQFMHDPTSFSHVFFNMFGLFMFGRLLEVTWGSKKLFFYYIVAGIGAGLIQQLFWEYQLHDLAQSFNLAILNNDGGLLTEHSAILSRYFRIPSIEGLRIEDMLSIKHQLFNAFNTVGASGALFGVLLAFAWLFPDIKMFLLFIPYPIPSRIFVGLYAVAELVFGVSNFAGDNIAHFAHLGGMIVGGIVLFIWKKQHKLYK